MSDCLAFVARLDTLTEAALTVPSADAKKLRTSVKTLRETGHPEMADTLEAQIPEAVKVDKTEGDGIASALRFLYPEDEAAKVAIARWEAARPTRGTGAPRKPDPSDNPQETWVTVLFDGREVTKYMRSAGGAITSLRYPAWAAMRDFRQPLAAATWKGCIEDFTALIHGSGGEFKVGDFTVKVKV